MALSIVNNTAALNAQNSLDRTNSSLGKSLERLSTGLKINRGADGPAALVISEQQRAQIAGLRTAIDNTNKAVSLVQTGEGALNEINRLLTKVRSLALDSANSGVNDADTLAANQAEITNSLASIDRISQTTQFGSKKLLDGSAGFNAIANTTALSGLNATKDTAADTYVVSNVVQAGQKGQVAVNDALELGNGVNLAADELLTFNGSVNVQLRAGQTNTQVRDAINAVTNQTGVEASLDSTTGNLQLTAKNFGQNFTVQSNVAAGADSTGVGTTLVDTNTAGGLVTFEGQDLTVDIQDSTGNTVAAGVVASGNVINVSTGVANGLSFTANADTSNGAVTDAAALNARVTVSDGTLTFQIGANQGQTAQLNIKKTTTDALGVNQSNNQFANLRDIDVTTDSGAQDSLAVIDAAIADISTQRGELGAFQSNTLESTANNLRTSVENLVAAESVVRDTDFATEIANFTKFQTQLQAGTTVLGNANQLTQLVASLLR